MFTLLCISLPVALWKENKNSLYLGKCLPCGNCHHMAAISEFKMAATLLDIPFSMIDICRLPCQLSLRKLLSFDLVQRAAMFNFTMTVALITGPFQWHCAYQDTCPRIIVPVAYIRSHHICKVGCIPGLS